MFILILLNYFRVGHMSMDNTLFGRGLYDLIEEYWGTLLNIFVIVECGSKFIYEICVGRVWMW